MRIGSGTHTYEWVEGWAKLPSGVSLGFTHGVTEDSQGRIYVHNTSKDAVIVFDADGNFLTSWGEEFAYDAHGMYLSREADGEYLYLSARRLHAVVKTTLDGKEVLRIPTPPTPQIYEEDKRLFIPTETVVAPNGDIYIADGYGQPWVHRFTAKGDYVQSIGGLGEEPGKLNSPHGVKIDTRGSEPLLLVSDRGNNRLQYFTLDGEFVRLTNGMIRLPCTTHQFGDELYIPDLHSRLTILDKDDHLVMHLGERAHGWRIPGWPAVPHHLREVGNFTSPHDLHVDHLGNIYVVEWIPDGRITKLARVSAN